MQWSEIRQAYPNHWLIIEALQAHTTADSRRRLDKIAIIERYQDGTAAMQSYRRLHQQYPGPRVLLRTYQPGGVGHSRTTMVGDPDGFGTR